MSFLVQSPGLHSLLTDFGRDSSRALGIPVGGAADRECLALGNALVGNPPDALALEMTLAGPTLLAEAPIFAVVMGASFALRVNEEVDIQPGYTFQLARGDTLTIGATRTQVRGYLCVAGGFDNRLILGSRSALQPIRAGEQLRCRPSTGTAGRSMARTFEEAEPSILRVIRGPQAEWFSFQELLAQRYRVNPSSNRMGVRLLGNALKREASELLSEPVAPGTVQITNDGLPVILGVDGQTIGGYPKIAQIIRADLDRVGQLRPGQTVRFEETFISDAEKMAREKSRKFAEWRLRIEASSEPVRFD